MTDQFFRDVLEWFMCSDPWVAAADLYERIETELDAEAVRRGFTDWVDAYHHFMKGEKV
ncbi:MAG: hypothetical protein NUV51_04510 [Sulfuricaulis sp.]|nr:hypothetical protein [Sulfuricaulis sp.]